MSPGYVPYRKPYLEHLAVETLKRHGRYLDVAKAAVDVELMIENQGYLVVACTKLPPHVEAYIAYEAKMVFVQHHQESPERVRMSLAEELAHIFLHIPELLRHNSINPMEVVQSFSDEQYLALERDAKHLAGAMLMDAALFKKRFREHTTAGLARGLVHERRPTKSSQIVWVLRQLANDFRVGITCAAMRAYKLSLIGEEVLHSVSS